MTFLPPKPEEGHFTYLLPNERLFLAELGGDEVFQSFDSLSFIRAVSDDRDFRAFDKTHAHDHENALSVNRLALCLQLNLGFELRSRLNKDGSWTSVDTSLVFNRNRFLSHLNLSILKIINVTSPAIAGT
jgi:hypothetical protein